VRISGVPTTCGLPDTKVGAEEAERLTISRVLQTGEVKPTPPPTSPEKEVPTVREFSATFLEHSRMVNKVSTYNAKEMTFRLHINPKLGHLRLNDVSYAAVADFTLGLASTPRGNASRRTPELPLCSKSINNTLKILHRMLVVAKKRQLITTLPDFELLKTPVPTFRFFSLQEIDRIISAAPRPWRAMIALASRTGLRIGELIGLRWEDVYLDSNVLVVRQNITKRVLTTPKSGKPREVPLSDETAEILRSIKHTRGPFVFATSTGGHVCQSRASEALRRACIAAKVTPAGWHTLRHSFASNLVESDTNLKAIQEMLGHASIRETERYAHLGKHHLRSAVNKLDRGNVAALWQQPTEDVVTNLN
jgi:integrase